MYALNKNLMTGQTANNSFTPDDLTNNALVATDTLVILASIVMLTPILICALILIMGRLSKR